MPSFDIGRPGLHLQSGASAVLGGVGELPGSRCTDFDPRARGGATDYAEQEHELREFQSTRPVWGATYYGTWMHMAVNISIHAPRVGRDVGRRLTKIYIAGFQSTRPVWGATTAGGLYPHKN